MKAAEQPGQGAIKGDVDPPAVDKDVGTLEEFYLISSSYIIGFFRLFFSRKFILHRVMGLVYLLQYCEAIFMYFNDYDHFLNSWLIITLPLTGVIQTIIAMTTFTFLPKRQADPGYYSDKSTLSYAFICENLFFTSILCFQWFYYNDRLYPYIKKFYVVEMIFVFLPYLFRPLFPKTRFRDSLKSLRNKSQENFNFYYYFTWLTKLFYIWAKHYIGFFLNYLRFINAATAYDQKCIFLLLISSCFATTISLFLHTLRFKRYINPKTSFTLYVISYMSTFYSYFLIFHVFFSQPLFVLICLGGIVTNLYHVRAFDFYQVCVMIYFYFFMDLENKQLTN